MCVQVMTPAEAQKVDFDPFDVTKVWPRGQFPMQEVGELVLNRNPEVRLHLVRLDIRHLNTQIGLSPRCGASSLQSWFAGARYRTFA